MKAIISIYIILLFIFINLPDRCLSQDMPVDEASGLITYQEVVEEIGTKDELFNRCSSWLPSFYSNPWDAAKVRDQASGLIKVQHQFKIYDYDEAGEKKEAGMVIYNLKIEFRENRYRYIVDNFLLKHVSRYPIESWLDQNRPDYDTRWKGYLEQVNSFVTGELIKSLKEKMKPVKEIIEKEW